MNFIHQFFLEKKYLKNEKIFKNKILNLRLKDNYSFTDYLNKKIINLDNRFWKLYTRLVQKLYLLNIKDKILRIEIPDTIYNSEIESNIKELFSKYDYSKQRLTISLNELIKIYLFEIQNFKLLSEERYLSFEKNVVFHNKDQIDVDAAYWNNVNKDYINSFLYKLELFFENFILLNLDYRYMSSSENFEPVYILFQEINRINKFNKSSICKRILEKYESKDYDSIMSYYFYEMLKKDIDDIFSYFYKRERKRLELLFINDFIFEYLIYGYGENHFFYLRKKYKENLYLNELLYLNENQKLRFKYKETQEFIKQIQIVYNDFINFLYTNKYKEVKKSSYVMFKSTNTRY